MDPKFLLEIRRRWSLTQQEVADIFEVSSPLIISHWETGFRNPSGIVKKLYVLLGRLSPDHGAQLLDWLKSAKLEDRERRQLLTKRKKAKTKISKKGKRD